MDLLDNNSMQFNHEGIDENSLWLEPICKDKNDLRYKFIFGKYTNERTYYTSFIDVMEKYKLIQNGYRNITRNIIFERGASAVKPKNVEQSTKNYISNNSDSDYDYDSDKYYLNNSYEYEDNYY